MDGVENRQGQHVFSDRLRGLTIGAFVLFASLGQMAALHGQESSSSELTRESIVRELNRHREVHGLGPLRSDERLDRAAEARILDMEEQEYWGHSRPDGTNPLRSLQMWGYIHVVAGENLAAGYETPEIVVQGWMESPGHRANILLDEYTDVGIAMIEGGVLHRLSGRSIVAIFARER
jgi:uncharacterized protein YkwD